MEQFLNSITGRKFFEKDIPKIVKSLEQIAFELKRSNDIAENKKGEENNG